MLQGRKLVLAVLILMVAGPVFSAAKVYASSVPPVMLPLIVQKVIDRISSSNYYLYATPDL